MGEKICSYLFVHSFISTHGIDNCCLGKNIFHNMSTVKREYIYIAYFQFLDNANYEIISIYLDVFILPDLKQYSE